MALHELFSSMLEQAGFPNRESFVVGAMSDGVRGLERNSRRD
jgi:hypothetical protein